MSAPPADVAASFVGPALREMDAWRPAGPPPPAAPLNPPALRSDLQPTAGRGPEQAASKHTAGTGDPLAAEAGGGPAAAAAQAGRVDGGAGAAGVGGQGGEDSALAVDELTLERWFIAYEVRVPGWLHEYCGACLAALQAACGAIAGMALGPCLQAPPSAFTQCHTEARLCSSRLGKGTQPAQRRRSAGQSTNGMHCARQYVCVDACVRMRVCVHVRRRWRRRRCSWASRAARCRA